MGIGCRQRALRRDDQNRFSRDAALDHVVQSLDGYTGLSAAWRSCHKQAAGCWSVDDLLLCRVVGETFQMNPPRGNRECIVAELGEGGRWVRGPHLGLPVKKLQILLIFRNYAYSQY